MDHSTPRSLVHTFSPQAGTNGEETVAEIGEGRAFYAEKMDVYVTSDPAGELELSLFNGQTRVAPDDNPLTLTQSDMDVRAGTYYDVGDRLTLRFTTTAEYTGGEVNVVVHGHDTRKGE